MASSGNDTPDRILPLSLCRLTPQGVASVIYHLRQHSTFADVTEEHLQAMAFAFLAQGGTSDNNHVVSPNYFHHIHYEAHTSTVGCTWRNQMRDFYVELVMDMVTWLDRLSGGATVLVHSPGNRLPGTWAIPEEARLDVFLPFVLLHERPALRAVFAHLVQYFAQYVATAAMERWDFVTSLDDDSLDDPTPPHWVSNRGVGQPLIPESDTPRRIFYGRRAGVVDLLIAAEGLDQAPPPTPPLLSPSLPSLTPSALPSPIVAPSAPPKNLNVAYTVAHERKMSPVPHNGAPEIAPSDSAARREVKQMALGADDLLSDLLFRIEHLQHDVKVQQAEISRLNSRLEREHNLRRLRNDSLSRRLDRHQDLLDEEVEPPADRKGKAPAQGRSSSSSVSLRPSLPASPSSTICDDLPTQEDSSRDMLVSRSTPVGGSTSAPSSFSHYASGRMHVIGGKAGSPSVPPLQAPSSPLRGPHASASSPSPKLKGTPHPSENRSPQIIPFGTFTAHIIDHYSLPSATHGHLRDVVREFDRRQWPTEIATYLPEASVRVIDELVDAMRDDRPSN